MLMVRFARGARLPALTSALFALLLLPSAALAATSVPPGPLATQTWTAADGPYIVQGDVEVPGGVTLTIEAGTEVQFVGVDPQMAGSDPDRVELNVNGELLVNGTAQSPVTFKPDAGTTMGHWSGLRILSGATQANISHAIILYGSQGFQSAAKGAATNISNTTASYSLYNGFDLSDGAPTLTNVTASYNGNSGIRVGDPASATITNVASHHNKSGILAANGAYSFSSTTASAWIVNALVHENTEHGVFISSSTGDGSGAGPADMTMINATVHANGDFGGSTYALGAGSKASLTVKNSILTGHKWGVSAVSSMGGTGTVTITHSDVWGNTTDYVNGAAAGVGCISQDPLFVMAPSDLRLKAMSPCIDAGSPTDAPFFDIEGGDRPLNGDGVNGLQTDMGAYEYNPLSACGDGALNPGEVCDDGDQNGAYGHCKADCSGFGPSCGDAMVNGPEACDDGNGINTDACLSTCVAASCGDGFVQSGVEQCDDGNLADGDGCSALCATENAGAGGAGGAGGDSVGAGGSGPGGSGGTPDDDGGCGCRTAGSPGDPRAVAILALFGAAALLRRRRLT